MNQRGDNSSSNKKESPRNPRHITGKELKYYEEIRTQVSTLVEMLDEKGIINKREYQRIVSMRLHELSKALAFEEIQDEI